MELKDYQKRVVTEVEHFLRALESEHEKGNRKHGATDAWEAVARKLKLRRYESRRNGLGEDLPTFCIKVPTGGGKTLLATQILGSLYRTILRDRGGAGGGAGLVLWVVPSSQIYRDTRDRLKDRNDIYRVMLEHAASRRIEVWEKHEIARLSPARLRDCLNILILQLASTNRETKEQLRFFKDSGGNIVNHFPSENEPEAHLALKQRVPNLDMIEHDEKSGRHLCATSIGNLVRLCRPPVILDEGHKATSDLARRTIEDFNASIVVELSATPATGLGGANILSTVTGQELLDEEMIKLPLNVKTSAKKNWQDVVTEARDKRIALAKLAARHASESGDRLIRPIVLVQVERTGKDQREQGKVHSEDVKEFLRNKLDIPEHAIAIKSASNDGLEDIDLMSDGCPVEWIITKSALQEGWDCPFAYILVSLDTTESARALTQLVGRVLRQPFQKRLPGPYAALNESYAYCRHSKPAEVLKQVKTALENEGYEGDAQSLVRTLDDSEKPAATHSESLWRKGIKAHYTRPFEGKIFLPRFCVQDGDGYEPLDYYQHLVSRVDVAKFDYKAVGAWEVAKLIKDQKDRVYRVTLGGESSRESETEVDNWESDETVLAWMVANLDIDCLSHKQLRVIVGRVYERLAESELTLKGRLATAKTEIRAKLNAFIHDQMDKATEAAFGQLYDSKQLLFYLQCKECRFEVPESISVERVVDGRSNSLVHDDGEKPAKSLFDFVEQSGMNPLERQVALVLDRDAEILWWYRNKVGKENFAIQGYRKHRIYPDLVAQGEHEGKPVHRVLVIETKGNQLEGNQDTTYKRKVASYFEKVGHRVSWQQLGSEFKDHTFRFQVVDESGPDGSDWRDALGGMLSPA